MFHQKADIPSEDQWMDIPLVMKCIGQSLALTSSHPPDWEVWFYMLYSFRCFVSPVFSWKKCGFNSTILCSPFCSLSMLVYGWAGCEPLCDWHHSWKMLIWNIGGQCYLVWSLFVHWWRSTNLDTALEWSSSQIVCNRHGFLSEITLLIFTWYIEKMDGFCVFTFCWCMKHSFYCTIFLIYKLPLFTLEFN